MREPSHPCSPGPNAWFASRVDRQPDPSFLKLQAALDAWLLLTLGRTSPLGAYRVHQHWPPGLDRDHP